MCRRVTTYCLIVISLLVAASAAESKAKSEVGTVHVVVVDGLGAKLEGGEIKSFKNQQSGKDFANRFYVDRFLEKTAANIPYGPYVVQIRQPGFPDVERPAHVSAADTEIQVCVRTATVHIVDVSPGSGGLQLEIRSFTSREDDFDLAKNFRRDTAERVPYGIYDLRVAKPYFREVQRRVDVFQPDVWVVLDLEVSPISLPEYRAPGNVVKGTIHGVGSSEQPVYVSLIGIHQTFLVDDKVSLSGTSGTFILVGFNPRGKFLLATSGRSGILDIRQVDIPISEPIVIDLENKGEPRQ